MDNNLNIENKFSYIGDFLDKRYLYDNVPKYKSFYLKQDRYDILKGYIENKIVLDFGSGKNTLKNQLKYLPKQYDTYDYDINNKLAMYHNLKDINTIYDIIIAAHIFEHEKTLTDLYNDLEWCYNHTDKLIIVVPNHTSCNDSMRDDITHNFILNTPDFISLLDKTGFKVDKIILTSICKNTHKFDTIRYLIRAIIVILMVESPFFDFAMICSKKEKE